MIHELNYETAVYHVPARGRFLLRYPVSLAKMLSDVAGQERWVFCAGVVQSSNGGLSGMGAEQVFASRRESARSTPPAEPEIFDL